MPRITGPLFCSLMVFAAGGCGRFADRTILLPSTDPIPTPAERIEIAGPDGALELFRLGLGKAEPRCAVLALTGNAGRAEHAVLYAGEFHLGNAVPAGWPGDAAIYALQWPGFGGSEGRARLAALGPAAEAAFAEVRRRHPDLPLLVHSLSLGTTAGLHLAAEGADAGWALVCEKPPDLWRQILVRHGWWNLWLVALPTAWSLPANVRSDRLAARGRVPAVFVAGRYDRGVPPAYSRRIAERYGAVHRFCLAEGGHAHPITPGNCPDLHEAMVWLHATVTDGAPHP